VVVILGTIDRVSIRAKVCGTQICCSSRRNTPRPSVTWSQQLLRGRETSA
jgi:hypothetical protein